MYVVIDVVKNTIFYILFSIDFLMILILTLQRWKDRFPIQNNKPFQGFFRGLMRIIWQKFVNTAEKSALTLINLPRMKAN